MGLVEPWLKVPHNYEAQLFDHNSQSCVEIKWSSNNINFVDSTFMLLSTKAINCRGWYDTKWLRLIEAKRVGHL